MSPGGLSFLPAGLAGRFHPAAHQVQVCCQVRWQFGMHGNIGPCRWRSEAQPVGVKEHAPELGETFDGVRRTIDGIANQRMLEEGEVRPNLMRSPSADAHFEIAEFVEAFEQFPLRVSASSGFQPCRHARSPDRVASDRPVDMPCGVLDVPMHQRPIGLLDLPALKLAGEGLMSGVGTGHHDDAAGVFVQTVDNARPQLAAQFRQTPEVVQKRIHKGARVVTCAGMHHHTGRLVDDHQVGILV